MNVKIQSKVWLKATEFALIEDHCLKHDKITGEKLVRVTMVEEEVKEDIDQTLIAFTSDLTLFQTLKAFVHYCDNKYQDQNYLVCYDIAKYFANKDFLCLTQWCVRRILHEYDPIKHGKDWKKHLKIHIDTTEKLRNGLSHSWVATVFFQASFKLKVM